MSKRVATRRRALSFAVTMGVAVVLAETFRPQRTVRTADSRLRLEDVFPAQLADWRADRTHSAFVRPADEQGKLYGVYDAVLERTYFNSQGESVMLSVAYGSEQSPALQVHRPEVCYTASGFDVNDVHRDVIGLGVRNVPVTRLHASMIGRSEPVTYWTVLDDEVVAGKGAFRWHQLQSGLRRQVADGMLVRISSIEQDRQTAFQRHRRFAADLYAAVEDRHRPRVFGKGVAS